MPSCVLLGSLYPPWAGCKGEEGDEAPLNLPLATLCLSCHGQLCVEGTPCLRPPEDAEAGTGGQGGCTHPEECSDTNT